MGLKLKSILLIARSTCLLICHWKKQGAAAFVWDQRTWSLCSISGWNCRNVYACVCSISGWNKTEMEQNRGLSSPPQRKEYNNTLILVFPFLLLLYSIFPHALRGEWAVALKHCEDASVCQKILPEADLSPCRVSYPPWCTQVRSIFDAVSMKETF